MYIDIYEINLLSEQDETRIIDSLLLECQCALFFVDTNTLVR